MPWEPDWYRACASDKHIHDTSPRLRSGWLSANDSTRGRSQPMASASPGRFLNGTLWKVSSEQPGRDDRAVCRVL